MSDHNTSGDSDLATLSVEELQRRYTAAVLEARAIADELSRRRGPRPGTAND